MNKEFNGIITIAYRDVIKLLRDRVRILSTFIFPFIFIAVLGGSLQANLGSVLEYNFLTFVFTGILGQTIFQSTASGIISLIEDRENDFSQELFVTPISRYSIILGKILGESLVAFVQMLGIIGFAYLIQVPIEASGIVRILPASLVIAFFGASFGVIVMSGLSSQRSANQIFPFIIFPQFFLAGVFNPIQDLPSYLWILSRIAPMTYAVDFIRNFYYQGQREYSSVVLHDVWVNFGVISVLSLVFIVLGTTLFIRQERNR